MDGIWHSIVTVIILLFVICAAYFATRIIAGKAMPGHRKSQHIKIIDNFYLSRDKMILLVSAGERAYLIGVTNQSFTLLDSFDVSELPVPETEQTNEMFPRLMKRLGKFDFSQFGRAKTGGGAFGEYYKEMKRKEQQKAAEDRDRTNSD